MVGLPVVVTPAGTHPPCEADMAVPSMVVGVPCMLTPPLAPTFPLFRTTFVGGSAGEPSRAELKLEVTAPPATVRAGQAVPVAHNPAGGLEGGFWATSACMSLRAPLELTERVVIRYTGFRGAGRARQFAKPAVRGTSVLPSQHTWVAPWAQTA